MSLPSFIRNRPVISGFVTLLFVGVLGAAAFTFAQGTLFGGDAGCEWSTVEVEDTGQTFSSMEDLQEYQDSKGEEIPETHEVMVRDGVVQQRLTNCEGTTIGGESTG